MSLLETIDDTDFVEITPPDEQWAPMYFTPPLLDRTRGEDILETGELFMKAKRGARANQPLEFTQWQNWLIRALFEEKCDGTLRYKTALIGLPRKNGKSMLGTAIALNALLWGQMGDEIYSAASSREQAKIVFGYAKQQVLQNPILREKIIIRRDFMENRATGAIYKALSAEGSTAQGLAPSLVIADELHTWKGRKGQDLWSALKDGSADRAESLVIAITTADDDPDSVLSTLMSHTRKAADYQRGTLPIEQGGVDDPSVFIAWWAAPESADPFDPETWMTANPNIAEGLMPIENFKSQAALAATVNLNSFKRYHLNQQVRADDKTRFLTPSQFDETQKYGEKIPLGAEIALGFDGSFSNDSTAFVGIDLQTGLMNVLGIWEKDNTDVNWTVPRHEVLDRKEQIFKDYKVKRFYFDRKEFETDVESWVRSDNTGGQIITMNLPQSQSRMNVLNTRFKINLLEGEIFHDGSDLMRKHYLNAVQRTDGHVSKDTKDSPRKIDVLIASVIANAARNDYLNIPAPSVQTAWWG